MLTNQLKNAFLAGAFWKNATFYSYDGSNRKCAVSGNNTSLPCLGYLGKYITDYTSQGVVFGNGTVEPSADDYKLSGSIVSSKLGVTARVTRNADDDGCTNIAVFTITNNGSSAVTISEVALFDKFFYTQSNDTLSSTYAMLDRTLLDAPLVIPAGDVGLITYTIRINFPDLVAE